MSKLRHVNTTFWTETVIIDQETICTCCRNIERVTIITEELHYCVKVHFERIICLMDKLIKEKKKEAKKKSALYINFLALHRKRNIVTTIRVLRLFIVAFCH